jgi:polygalacturonase
MKSKSLFSMILIVVLLTGVSCTEHSNGIYNIKKFGAEGDGRKINTISINKAIDKCFVSGGGTVIVPPGKFITGTIVLKSNVNLHLEPGAVLFGSSDTSDYLKMNKVEFSEGYNKYGMIMAMEAENISITGQGEINGNGTIFMNGLDKPHMGGHDFIRKFTRQGETFMKEGDIFEDGPVSYQYRPGLLITFESCGRILISGVTLKDSPEWTIRIGECDDVEINGISIQNNKLIPNSDGIHCTTSRNVRISNCNIFAGDDAIIVTGFGYRPVPGGDKELLSKTAGNKTGYAENVTVTNCILSSRSACIRVGYGEHPIRNLVFSNLVMYDSNRGIGVFARNNSRIENVLFSDIIINNRLHSGHWWGKGEPIHVSAIQDTENGTPGTIENIRFRDIIATSETGIVLAGTEKSILKDISLSNIILAVKRGKYSETYGGNFDLRPAWPLEKAVFSHEIPGIFAGFVINLKISDFELKWGEDMPQFFTEAINIEHFRNVSLSNITGNPAHRIAGTPSVIMSNGEKAVLSNIVTEKEFIPYSLNNVSR